MKKSPNAVDVHVGRRVRMRRLSLGMSQERLGDALGVTFQQVQKYEKGANRIGASRLQQIGATLRVPPSFFFEGAPGADGGTGSNLAMEPDFTADFLATADGIALARAFVAIANQKTRRRIVDLVEQIAENGRS